MNVTELINLYTNLFIITVTFVGILLASIIALTQLLEPLLVSRAAQRLVRPLSLRISVILICVSVILTLPSMAILSLDNHDIVPQFDFKIDGLLSNPMYIAFAVLAVLATGVSIVLFIYRVSRLLVPVNVLVYLKNSNRRGVIADFFTMTGAAQPTRPFLLTTILSKKTGNIDTSQNGEDSEEEIQRRYEVDLRKYEVDRKRLAKTENPLVPIETYLTRAIQRSNITVVTNTLKALEEIISGLTRDESFKGSRALIEYYRVVLENAHELAQANGLQTVSLELLDSSSRIADTLVDTSRYDALITLESYWRNQASEALNVNPAIFKKAVSILGEVARTILRNSDIEWKTIQDLLDNIMRGLGWLGERLLDAGAPEKRELMLNDNETQFEAIMNAVLNLSWDMNKNRADVYPLIYFDCLYVISKKLAPYVENETKYDGDNGNSLFSLMYEVFNFGEAAIAESNINGVSLSVLKLEDHIRIAEETKNQEHKQHALESLFRLGALVAGRKLEGSADFIGRGNQNIDDAIIEKLVKHKAAHSLDNEAHEILIKTSTNGNIDEIIEYLRKASGAFETSLGLNLTKNEDDD